MNSTSENSGQSKRSKFIYADVSVNIVTIISTMRYERQQTCHLRAMSENESNALYKLCYDASLQTKNLTRRTVRFFKAHRLYHQTAEYIIFNRKNIPTFLTVERRVFVLIDGPSTFLGPLNLRLRGKHK